MLNRQNNNLGGRCSPPCKQQPPNLQSELPSGAIEGKRLLRASCYPKLVQRRLRLKEPGRVRVSMVSFTSHRHRTIVAYDTTQTAVTSRSGTMDGRSYKPFKPHDARRVSPANLRQTPLQLQKACEPGLTFSVGYRNDIPNQGNRDYCFIPDNQNIRNTWWGRNHP